MKEWMKNKKGIFEAKDEGYYYKEKGNLKG